jgi:hypothetical protein
VKAELIASATFPPRSFARRLPGIGWIVQTHRPDVIVLGDDLRERARFLLPSAWSGFHWVTPDLAAVAISERDSVLLADRDGRVVWHFEHHPWGGSDSESGCCWISADGRQVWATVPRDDGPDLWLVLDAADGRLLASNELQCWAAGSHPVPYPNGRDVGLSVGEGQDGAEVYWGRWDGSRFAVSRLDSRSRVLVDVRPSGEQYLTTPHSNADGFVAVHEFPSGRVLARLLAKDVLPEGDWFDYAAGYVRDETIIVGSAEQEIHLLLDAGTLAVLGQIQYPDGHVKGSPTASGRGTWLTSDYASGRHEWWRLAEDA